MPSRPTNVRNDGDQAAQEYAVGSLPVGSWVELYDLNDVLIYRGVVKDQRATWGYTVVMPITEGDGNFGGAVESGSLYRLYSMSDHHYVQAECPVTWLGVDQELKAELEPITISRESEAESENFRGPYCPTSCDTYVPSGKPMSLVPTVSLVPEEVYDDDDDRRNGSISGTTD